jgi:lipid II:glycine glycyltransferase (peptidoglycan interpeptide bridge formation enzyme)
MNTSDYSFFQLNKDQWDLEAKKCPQFNLIQSWEYGEAKKAQNWWPVRYAVHHRGESIAIVQVLLKKLGPLGFVARVNRGPMFFEGQANNETVRGTFQLLNQESRRQRWLYLSISPELPPSEEFETALRSLGYTKRPAIPWGSSILDLSLTEEQLFQKLQNPWPKNLRKTDKAGIVLKVETPEEGMDLLLKRYEEMKASMNFGGIPNLLIAELGKQKGPTWDVRILHATLNGEILASLLCIGSQNLCTPLIAWTKPEARDLRVSNFVYWRAFLLYRELGFRWFDLGGLSPETPKGIAQFKRDIGGQEYSSLGEWQRPLILPNLVGRLALKGK